MNRFKLKLSSDDRINGKDIFRSVHIEALNSDNETTVARQPYSRQDLSTFRVIKLFFTAYLGKNIYFAINLTNTLSVIETYNSFVQKIFLVVPQVVKT